MGRIAARSSSHTHVWVRHFSLSLCKGGSEDQRLPCIYSNYLHIERIAVSGRGIVKPSTLYDLCPSPPFTTALLLDLQISSSHIILASSFFPTPPHSFHASDKHALFCPSHAFQSRCLSQSSFHEISSQSGNLHRA